MNIKAIAKIADDKEKAKEITRRVMNRACEEYRPFGDILQEEIEKIKRSDKNG